MQKRDRQWWIDLLSASAGAAGNLRPHPDDFRDELGHRRDLHAPLLAWRRTRPGGSGVGSAALDPWVPSPPSPAAGPDVRLWAALTNASIDVEAVLATLGARTGRSAADEGALVPQGLLATIEVWTETELAALHALWWLGQTRGKPAWCARAQATTRWHIEHLQPDNATGRPWGIHLFAMLALEGNGDADLYAQTLLHNAQVSMGRPDALSAHILADAADALRPT